MAYTMASTFSEWSEQLYSEHIFLRTFLRTNGTHDVAFPRILVRISMGTHKGERYFLAIGVLCVAIVAVVSVRSKAASAPQMPGQPPSRFLGAWCAQGDPAKQCSVSMNGLFLTFTNESGSTSSAHYIGVDQNVVSADQWGLSARNAEPGWNEDQLVERHLLGTLFGRRRRRRAELPECGRHVVPRRRPFEIVLHTAEKTKFVANERTRRQRNWEYGRALASDDKLGGNDSPRHDQPRREHDLLGQQYDVDEVGAGAEGRIRLNLGAHLTKVAANEGHIENRGGALFAVRGFGRLYFAIC